MSVRKRTYTAVEEMPPLAAFKKRRQAAITLQRAFRSRKAAKTAMGAVEVKFHDSSISSTTITASANLAGCEMDTASSCIPWDGGQGDTYNARDGRKTHPVAVHISGMVHWSQLADQADMPTGNAVVIWLILDKQTNGTQMSAEDCLVNPSGNSIQAVSAFPQPDRYSRYQILRKVIVNRNAAGAFTDGASTGSVQGQISLWDMHVKFPTKFYVEYSTTTAGVSAIINNSLHIIATCALSDGTWPKLAYNCRSRFVG